MSDPVVNIISSIVMEIVDEPELVKVTSSSGERATVIEVTASEKDIGKVIGRRGAMAKALRTICSSISGKRDHRYLVHILE